MQENNPLKRQPGKGRDEASSPAVLQADALTAHKIASLAKEALDTVFSCLSF